MKSLLSILLLFTGSALFCQTIIKGKIIDSETKKPISQVVVTLNNNEKSVISDSAGNFKMSSFSTQFNLHAKKLGYTESHVKFEKADTASLKIVLTKKAFDLAEVEIDAEKRSEIIKNKRFYVEDYFILPNQTYLLITSYFGEKCFNVMLANNNNKVMYTKKLEGEVDGELFLDCLGNIHILSQTSARQVYLNSDTTFAFLTSISRQNFDSTIAPCVTKIENSYFFKKHNPAYDFTREGVKVHVNSNQALVYKIEKRQQTSVAFLTYDDETITMFNDELAFQERRKNTPGVRYSPTDILIAYQAIYRKINTPIFNTNDTLVIIDTYKHQINHYLKDGKLNRSIAIEPKDFPSYHALQFLFDRVTHQVYLLTKESSHQYLRKINLNTGKLFPPIKLYNDFAKKIQVYGDDIYYILKDLLEEDGSAYLYKQRF